MIRAFFFILMLLSSHALAEDSTSEEIKLNDGRILVFYSEPVIYQRTYSVTLEQQSANGQREALPLTIERYNFSTQKLETVDSVGFASIDFTFDPKTNILDYAEKSSGYGPSYVHRYELKKNHLHLLELKQSGFDPKCEDGQPCNFIEKTIYTESSHAN